MHREWVETYACCEEHSTDRGRHGSRDPLSTDHRSMCSVYQLMGIGWYLRGMAARVRLVAFLVAVALVAAACGNAVAAVDEVESNVDASGDQAAEFVSLGEREAGFGPGSLAVAAGDYASRILDVEGEWFPQQPHIYRELPEVCGLSRPQASHGGNVTEVAAAQPAFGEVLAIDVLVYASPAEAASQIALLNAPTADDCDLTVLDQRLEEESAAPGVEFDFGDGIGNPTETSFALPDGFTFASRRYEGAIVIGSIRQDFAQIVTWVADGRYLLQLTAVSTSGDELGLSEEMANAVFATPGPELARDPELDEVVDALRASVLPNDALPPLFEPAQTLALHGPPLDDDSCYRQFNPEVQVAGPSWIAISPGVGGSVVGQNSAFHASEEDASTAFAELIDLGTDCFGESIGLLPEPDFRLVEGVLEIEEVDGFTVVQFDLDYIQTVGTQEFDVEVRAAFIQTGRFSAEVTFVGLAGDSPDLIELVVLAADELSNP